MSMALRTFSRRACSLPRQATREKRLSDDQDAQGMYISPFDQIRQQDAEGNEYWSARALAETLGYTRWQKSDLSLTAL